MQQVYFSRLGMPDNIEEVETVEFVIRWEVSYNEGDHDRIDAASYDEIKELLAKKLEVLLKDKGADIARILQSSVHHKTKYEPFVSEISGEYKAVLYKLL
ncbi:hypothetical protein [Turneriella parva]|uniref:Uncharacterized protein n=1 Tax=Turneriella parva (strain ATCC BAA-1111 / DSM 21527 / NCTC 11395 / H) TaxID=869212 RepID=I4B192_TURPD|nr:hypothetical protein [Turneriella parva]AFM11049.1 hypothetical protein Turpa_0393 [Turneriella parva DSM 21527]